MNADQLAAEIIESTRRSRPDVTSLERLSTEEAGVLVPIFVAAFKERGLWPKDAAMVIAACRPTDDQLLELLRNDREPCQKLGLHVLALRMESKEFRSIRHPVLADEVLRLLQSDTFRPKQKDLRPLKAWAEFHLTQAETPS